MAARVQAPVLVLNGGSSSIKFALFTAESPPGQRLRGTLERIGLSDPRLTVEFTAGGAAPTSRPIEAADHRQAATLLLDWLSEHATLTDLRGVGHRIVHGGVHRSEACLVTPRLLEQLEQATAVQPEHLPVELSLIRTVGERLAGLPQVACFDSAFHRDLPRVASLLALPRRYQQQGLRRFGFHGLSYSYLMQELARVSGAEAARGRIVLAHLGGGASMAAVRDGKCIDTSMSFTPASGMMMATRSGDLDPGVMVHLMRSEGLDASALDDLVNRQSGLLGVSGLSPDMRDLLAAAGESPAAADAVSLFCHHAKRWVGALAAVLGGLDTLVFSGGIGENASEVRARICADLQFLGVRLDPARNAAGSGSIAADGSSVDVRVIRTDEESMIARDVVRLLASERSDRVQ